MNILVAGSGGREHALAWKLAQTPNAKIFALPGNPGIANIAECLPGEGIDPRAILKAARSVSAELTIIGPESPLVNGVVDLFRADNMPIVGPDAEAAQLEGSKVYAKNFFQIHGIPTAQFAAVNNREDALNALNRFGYPVVVKADGLAAGKGVIIAHDRAAAEFAIQSLGPSLVIEEFLEGREVSFIVLSDGQHALPLLPARDYKRLLDGDQGPNTGGMGSFCESALLTDAETGTILDTIIYPTINATNFAGFLYAGLMMTQGGPKLLEYNVRLGDPEAQSLLHHLSSDLGELLLAAAGKRLDTQNVLWRSGASACVVLAAAGYPGSSVRGASITGIDAAQSTGAVVFHSGTSLGWHGPVTNGGRVLGVTASGTTREEAATKAYTAAEKIHFEGMQFRRDIGR